jgi:hypothetical protein
MPKKWSFAKLIQNEGNYTIALKLYFPKDAIRGMMFDKRKAIYGSNRLSENSVPRDHRVAG